MWDDSATTKVFYLDFMVGIAPLACRYENMNAFGVEIYFASVGS
jgi:hypothetical protein